MTLTKTTARRARKPRSPFHGYSISAINVLRSLTVTVARWERLAAAEQYAMLRPSWAIPNNAVGVAQVKMLDELETRALLRLARLPNWPAIAEQRRVAYLKRYDARAYEAHLQLTETNELRADLKKMRKRVTKLEASAAVSSGS